MLSTKDFRGKDLTLELLWTHLSTYDLWCYYLGHNIVLNKKVLSPIRDEKDPSAVFFCTKSGDILLKDFGLSEDSVLTIFKYLEIRHGWSFSECLQYIDRDFNLGYYNHVKKPVSSGIIHNYKPELNSINIKVKRGSWSQRELFFWLSSFSLETLQKLPIKPLESYCLVKGNNINEFRRKKDELLFVFSFGNAKYKIYRPNGTKKDKWMTNCDNDCLMGLDNLPIFGDSLFITKGMKELGILMDLELNSVALQGENSYPSTDLIKQLLKRFKTVYTIMDIDKPGLKSSLYMQEKYGFKPIYLPKEFIEEDSKLKDLDSIKKKIGLENIHKIIQKQL